MSRNSHAATRPWITPSVARGKRPSADLKLAYPGVFRICLLLSALFIGILGALFPRFGTTYSIPGRPDPIIIIIDDIPETQQATPGLAPPVPTAAAAVVAPRDTASQPRVDIDFLANLDVSVSMPRGMELDEETVGFWTVSREPVLIKEVIPEYPPQARRTGLEGVVFVKFAVGSNGRVKKAEVLKGPAVFHEPALKAVYLFEFIPAMQNRDPVAVWMTLPIRFQLVDAPDGISRFQSGIRRSGPGSRGTGPDKGTE